MAQISKYKKPVASDSCCWFSLLLFFRLAVSWLILWTMHSSTNFPYFPILFLKVSKFQNDFLKSSFLPKYERISVRISALYSTEILTMQCAIETLLHSQTNQRNSNFQHSPLITSKLDLFLTF